MYTNAVIIFCQILASCYGWRPYEMKIINQTVYSLDSNIFVNSTLHSNGYLDVDVEIFKPIPEVFVRCEVSFDSGLGKYELVVLNKTISVCRIFREPRYEPILQLIYKIILNYGNFPKTCPIPKKKYYVKQLLINTEFLPPIFPEKKGLIQATFLNKSYNILSGFTVYFVVEKKYQTKN